MKLIVLVSLFFGAVGAAMIPAQTRQATELKMNQGLVQAPVISDVKCTIEGNQTKIEVVGSHFGATPGERFLMMNSRAEKAIIEWNDQSIRFYPDSKIIFWDVYYSFAIGEGFKAVSNSFQKRIPWHISAVTPKSGIAGAIFNLVVPNLKPANDGYVVKLGAQVLTISGWIGYGTGNGFVHVRVPFGLAAGSYPVSLQKSGETASNTDQSFLVTIIK